LLQVLIDESGHIRRTTLDRADEGESAGLGSRHRAIRRRGVQRPDDVESLTRAHTVPAELLGQIGRVLRDRQVPTVTALMITTVPSGGALCRTPVLGAPGHDTVIAVTVHIFVQGLAQHSAGAEVDFSHHRLLQLHRLSWTG